MKNDETQNQPTPGSAIDLIRIALGINYFHFGFLKFYPDLSPAELAASYTAQRLSFYVIDPRTTLTMIAVLECVIGLCFLFKFALKWITPLFFFHMAATFLPLSSTWRQPSCLFSCFRNMNSNSPHWPPRWRASTS